MRRTWAVHRRSRTFDGDGLPRSASRPGRLRGLEARQGFIWQSQTFDCSSATGSSVFDFEGKGTRASSTVTSAISALRRQDGRDASAGEERELHAYETPIVADIDGSGRAKVLVPNNNVSQ